MSTDIQRTTAIIVLSAILNIVPRELIAQQDYVRTPKYQEYMMKWGANIISLSKTLGTHSKYKYDLIDFRLGWFSFGLISVFSNRLEIMKNEQLAYLVPLGFSHTLISKENFFVTAGTKIYFQSNDKQNKYSDVVEYPHLLEFQLNYLRTKIFSFSAGYRLNMGRWPNDGPQNLRSDGIFIDLSVGLSFYQTDYEIRTEHKSLTREEYQKEEEEFESSKGPNILLKIKSPYHDLANGKVESWILENGFVLSKSNENLNGLIEITMDLIDQNYENVGFSRFKTKINQVEWNLLWKSAKTGEVIHFKKYEPSWPLTVYGENELFNLNLMELRSEIKNYLLPKKEQ